MPTAKPKKKPRNKPTLAARADRHELYEFAVQSVDAEIDFVDKTFRRLKGRTARVLREDFCGTANSSCEWVRRRPTNIAFGIDLDGPTLDWGMEHQVGRLRPAARPRVILQQANVLNVRTKLAPDIVVAMNFSYFCFQTRELLRSYFRHVRQTLARGGILILDSYGGWESYREMTERRPIKPGPKGIGPFTYIWEQASYDPITGRVMCHISFKLRDGSKIRRAFTYDWRLWSLPEITELLGEAGFRNPTVYWEGTDPKTGDGNDVFKPAKNGDADQSFICYIVAEK